METVMITSSYKIKTKQRTKNLILNGYLFDRNMLRLTLISHVCCLKNFKEVARNVARKVAKKIAKKKAKKATKKVAKKEAKKVAKKSRNIFD